jgi:hypothetical protein
MTCSGSGHRDNEVGPQPIETRRAFSTGRLEPQRGVDRETGSHDRGRVRKAPLFRAADARGKHEDNRNSEEHRRHEYVGRAYPPRRA